MKCRRKGRKGFCWILREEESQAGKRSTGRPLLLIGLSGNRSGARVLGLCLVLTVPSSPSSLRWQWQPPTLVRKQDHSFPEDPAGKSATMTS